MELEAGAVVAKHVGFADSANVAHCKSVVDGVLAAAPAACQGC